MCTLHASYCSLFWFYLTWTDRRYFVVSERDNKLTKFRQLKSNEIQTNFSLSFASKSSKFSETEMGNSLFLLFHIIHYDPIDWRWMEFFLLKFSVYSTQSIQLHSALFDDFDFFLLLFSLVWFAIEFIRLIVCVRPCGLCEQRHWQNYQPNPMWTSCGHCTRFVCCFHICKPNNLLSVRTKSQATEWWTKKKSHIRTVQNPLSAWIL